MLIQANSMLIHFSDVLRQVNNMLIHVIQQLMLAMC